MNVANVQIPHSLYDHLKEIAKQQQITVDQFVASAVAEKMSAMEDAGYIARRAERADDKTFAEALSKIPDCDPAEHDRL